METRILKGRAPVAPRRIAAAVWDADRRVREMVAAAEAEARRIVAEAEDARSRLHAEAVAAGRAEGAARAAALVASAAAERERLVAAAGPELARLAVDIARKVLGRELALDPGAVVEIAAQAIAAARDRRELILRVNPEDAAAVRAAEGRLAGLALAAPLEIVEDPRVDRGGAVLDTEAGRVDARVETQLAELSRALEEACA